MPGERVSREQMLWFASQALKPTGAPSIRPRLLGPGLGRYRELGVRYVLEGSVRKVGDQVPITAQLVDAVAGHHLWAKRYDRDLNDIFGVQDEVSQKIAIALKVILTAAEEAG